MKHACRHRRHYTTRSFAPYRIHRHPHQRLSAARVLKKYETTENEVIISANARIIKQNSSSTETKTHKNNNKATVTITVETIERKRSAQIKE